MGFNTLFKRHSKQRDSVDDAENANTVRRESQEQLPAPYHDASASNNQDVAQDAQAAPASITTTTGPKEADAQSLLPAYAAAGPAQPPRYRALKPDPHDPHGVPYGYQYEENAQNFAHPSSVAKEYGKEMKYSDPKAAELARRASESGREDQKEMLNYFLRQQELGKKSVDNSIAAWNGV